MVNLAAQAGVRYSIENPLAYIDSNIVGFAHVLEGCRHNGVEHLVYASSSSVYGANTAMPFSVHQNVDHPLSLYAASKKSNELMAHTYSHLYGLPTTGLRFFTVYGPWGRPDMALFKFTKAILAGETIQVFNHGQHRRDFTYIDDIVEGVIRILDRPAQGNSDWNSDQPDPGTSRAPWRVYNIGNNLTSGGIVKKRVALPGRGKRGGARTLVATRKADRWFYVFGFEKNERANVSAADLEALQILAEELLSRTDKDLDALMQTDKLIEMCYGYQN